MLRFREEPAPGIPSRRTGFHPVYPGFRLVGQDFILSTRFSSNAQAIIALSFRAPRGASHFARHCFAACKTAPPRAAEARSLDGRQAAGVKAKISKNNPTYTYSIHVYRIGRQSSTRILVPRVANVGIAVAPHPVEQRPQQRSSGCATLTFLRKQMARPAPGETSEPPARPIHQPLRPRWRYHSFPL